MGVVDDVTFEAARAGLAAALRLAMTRLDLRGRARVLVAVDREGGLDGMVPLALHRRFLVDRPAVDDEEVRPLIARVLADLTMEELGPVVVRQLHHATLLDGRRRAGWPEIVMFESLLLEAGAQAAPVVLRDRLHGDAHRIAALVTGALQLDVAERERRAGRTDAEGRPLYRDLDGAPTTRDSVEVQSRDAGFALLYRAPPEMTHDPLRRGYAEDELWRRFFLRHPDGKARMQAWLRDPGNRVTTRQLLPALDEAHPPDPARLLNRYCDAVLIARLAAPLQRELTSLLSLDDGSDAESTFVELRQSSELRRSLRHASATLDGSCDRIRGLVAALGATLGVLERPEESEDGEVLAIDGLSEAELAAAAREPNDTLPARLRLARAIQHWLGPGATRERLELNEIHPALLAQLTAIAGEGEVPAALSPSVLRSLLRAQRMLERGTEALSALGDPSDDAQQMAGALAVELATAALERNLRDAIATEVP